MAEPDKRVKEMSTAVLNGTLFAKMIKNGAANLYSNRTVVNDLNVFPIPDGDTGDNMYMTIDAGVIDVEADTSLEGVALAAAKGMLLGARGNSGVILSRIFAGIAAGFKGVSEADPAVMSKAFSEGVSEAYRAVATPVEGTILTVYKDAVNYAAQKVDGESTVDSYFADFTCELRRSLDRTPDLLDVLKEAGVVDSGGAGFVYIAEGMKDAIGGIELEGGSMSSVKAVDISGFTSDSVMEFGYCTEFLLRLQSSKVDVEGFDVNAFTDSLAMLGDSIVAFKDDSIVKVHIHSMTPGKVLEFCQSYGEFLTMKIENMMLQHNEATVENRFSAASAKPHKEYGIVAVAAGAGMKELFTSLGADEVVDGGQSMNPSSADFLEAFEKINADTILVYPNNGNIILTAQQAAKLYNNADVRVIPSKTVGEGYASLSMLDVASGDTEAILAEACEIMSEVTTGIVSKASRDAEMNGVSVSAGDYIGFDGDVIHVDSPSAKEAVITLSEKLEAAKRDVLILICGSGANSNEAQEICTELEEKYRRTEVIMIDGGQPIHDYILVLE